MAKGSIYCFTCRTSVSRKGDGRNIHYNRHHATARHGDRSACPLCHKHFKANFECSSFEAHGSAHHGISLLPMLDNERMECPVIRCSHVENQGATARIEHLRQCIERHLKPSDAARETILKIWTVSGARAKTCEISAGQSNSPSPYTKQILGLDVEWCHQVWHKGAEYHKSLNHPACFTSEAAQPTSDTRRQTVDIASEGRKGEIIRYSRDESLTIGQQLSMGWENGSSLEARTSATPNTTLGLQERFYHRQECVTSTASCCRMSSFAGSDVEKLLEDPSENVNDSDNEEGGVTLSLNSMDDCDIEENTVSLSSDTTASTAVVRGSAAVRLTLHNAAEAKTVVIPASGLCNHYSPEGESIEAAAQSPSLRHITFQNMALKEPRGTYCIACDCIICDTRLHWSQKHQGGHDLMLSCPRNNGRKHSPCRTKLSGVTALISHCQQSHYVNLVPFIDLSANVKTATCPIFKCKYPGAKTPRQLANHLRLCQQWTKMRCAKDDPVRKLVETMYVGPLRQEEDQTATAQSEELSRVPQNIESKAMAGEHPGETEDESEVVYTRASRNHPNATQSQDSVVKMH